MRIFGRNSATWGDIEELRKEITELRSRVLDIDIARERDCRMAADIDVTKFRYEDKWPYFSVREVLQIVLDHLGLELRAEPAKECAPILAKTKSDRSR